MNPPPSEKWVQVGVQEAHVLHERYQGEGGAKVRPPSKDSATVWKDLHKLMVKSGQTFHPSYTSGYLLPDGRQVPIYRHTAHEAEVEEGECSNLNRCHLQVRGGQCRS